MSDDPMEHLAAAARARAADEAKSFDPRWRALTHGTLSEDDEAALRQEGAESPRQRDAVRAFEPMGAAVKARIAAQARAELSAFQHAANDSQPATPKSANAPAQAARPSAPRQRQRRRKDGSRRITALAAAVVATLGLAYWANFGTPAVDTQPIAPFHMTLEGGRAPLRSAPDVPRTTFGPGSLLTIELLPETAFEDQVEVALFVARDNTVMPVSLPGRAITRYPGGAIHIRAELGRDWSPTAGVVSLLAVLGRPGSLPSADALAAYRETPQTQREAPSWQLFAREITLVDQ